VRQRSSPWVGIRGNDLPTRLGAFWLIYRPGPVRRDVLESAETGPWAKPPRSNVATVFCVVCCCEGTQASGPRRRSVCRPLGPLGEPQFGLGRPRGSNAPRSEFLRSRDVLVWTAFPQMAAKFAGGPIVLGGPKPRLVGFSGRGGDAFLGAKGVALSSRPGFATGDPLLQTGPITWAKPHGGGQPQGGDPVRPDRSANWVDLRLGGRVAVPPISRRWIGGSPERLRPLSEKLIYEMGGSVYVVPSPATSRKRG